MRVFFCMLLTFGVMFAQRTMGMDSQPDWLGLSTDSAKYWSSRPLPGEFDAFWVEPRPATSAIAKTRLAFLYAKSSPAYDISFNRILSVLRERGLAARILAVNFNNNYDSGRRVLRFLQKEKIDMIFSMGSESTAFMVSNFRNGSIPVVTVCSKDPVLLGYVRDYEHGSGDNFAFTSLNMPVVWFLRYLGELKPELRVLGILSDATNRSAMVTQANPLADAARSKGVRVLPLNIRRKKAVSVELAEIVSSAVEEMRKSDPALRHSLFVVTGSTAVFEEMAVINRYSEDVPVIGMVPEIVGDGDASAGASVGISFESNAQLAAIYAITILSGKSRPGEMGVGVVAPPDIALNFKHLRRVGLKVPFYLFESASDIYDYNGHPVRKHGLALPSAGKVRGEFVHIPLQRTYAK